MKKNIKLWQKDWDLDPAVEAFETKGDLVLDQKLIPYDIKGSIAHAKMLYKSNLLTKKELLALQGGLREIKSLYEKGKFVLKFGDEDCHTKIEKYLTNEYGDVGKKIHTARSRNDQVLTALRLFTKDYLEQIEKEIKKSNELFIRFEYEYGKIPMPGYTHMQKAMPSSIGLWIRSFKDALSDDLKILKAIYKLNDQSPLGSAAGYGLPIKIDRKYAALLLGFSKVRENPIYCQSSRVKVDALTLSLLISILQTINKFASDVMLFTTSEFDFFKVNPEITTGSSIMPQKINLDIAELLRSKVNIILGNYVQIVAISSNLVTGYNRDFQDTKKPLIESLELTLSSLVTCQILLKNISPNKKVLKASMTKDLYVTEQALKLVVDGASFRDAYEKVGKKYLRGGDKNEI